MMILYQNFIFFFLHVSSLIYLIYHKENFQNKSGKISRKDFKNVIDGFCFRMSEAQFTKLMTILDPGNKGHVTYQSFFKLFQDTESSVSYIRLFFHSGSIQSVMEFYLPILNSQESAVLY